MIKMVDRDCENYNNECKYFHHEPYYTPNNYDLFFDYNSIPVNIPVEKAHDLRNRLQKLMPLSKIIHLNMDNDTFEEDNNIHFHTKLRIKYSTNEDPIQTQLKVTGSWQDLDEPRTSNVTYNVKYLSKIEQPIRSKIILRNIHNPLIYYSGTTNSSGVYVFNELPYGTYIEQILIDNYNFKVRRITISNAEESILCALEPKEDDDAVDENNQLQLNYYHNGILYSSEYFYVNGELTSNGEESYDDGELLSDSYSIDDSMIILYNDPDFEEINDLTEIKVDIIGLDNRVVDTVYLNFRNNYTKTSDILPIYYGDSKINYSLSYSVENCDIDFSYVDLVKINENEVVLL